MQLRGRVLAQQAENLDSSLGLCKEYMKKGEGLEWGKELGFWENRGSSDPTVSLVGPDLGIVPQLKGKITPNPSCYCVQAGVRRARPTAHA